ncbi:uncharacterized protein VP01_2980g2, partial [Puccinia sorghi]
MPQLLRQVEAHLGSSKCGKHEVAWVVIAISTMRNKTLQPGAPPLDSIHDTTCLPSKAFLKPASNKFSIWADVSIQLAIGTCHLESDGNGAAVLRLKKLFQVGYGKINL